jgi:hypothetical protein
MAQPGDQLGVWRYTKDLPEDRTNFAKAWKLFETYSKIPPEEIDAHVAAVVSLIECRITLPLSQAFMKCQR